jgi:Asp-tRNA(Asn)/Glu-tRNA(Gln) amidotransferase A subunit family amidase
MARYDLQTMDAPRLAGASLAAFVALLENPLTRTVATRALERSSGIERLRSAVLADAPCVAPVLARAPVLAGSPSIPAPDVHALAAQGGGDRRGFQFASVADYARAYRTGASDPARVAEALLAALARVDAAQPPLRAITACHPDDLRAQARASAERHRRAGSRSPLDGVPVAVKEEFDVAGYATTAGTSFLRRPAESDATIVARLRAAGALIYGKSNMHEIGIDVNGFNRAHGIARNPYDPACSPGGSSSGSAAAVAAGLGPIALAADGGGSIRVPAALCGVVGLKPTWSRVSEAGAFPLCWSVGHAGPIGATAADVAIAYATTAGPDPRDAATAGQPPVHLDGFARDDLSDLRLGVYTPWFEHAQPEIVAACRGMLDRLQARGAIVVPIELADLELARLAHGVTILGEMAVALEGQRAHHRELSSNTRLLLALGREFSGSDYLKAQQVRRHCHRQFEDALDRCDLVMTPSTAQVAPAIRPDSLTRGENDLTTTSALMRFAFPSNLTGHPAISFPAGYAANGLPIGMQAIARPWEEHVLLRIARVAELELERRKPRVHVDLLG